MNERLRTRICPSCQRITPRAAARCPWCSQADQSNIVSLEARRRAGPPYATGGPINPDDDPGPRAA